MNRNDVFQLVVDLVNDQGPLKSTELVTKVMSEYYQSGGTDENEKVDFVEIIAQCVERKMILEVEYTLPRMFYRVKSLYFPVGSIINVPVNHEMMNDYKKNEIQGLNEHLSKL